MNKEEFKRKFIRKDGGVNGAQTKKHETFIRSLFPDQNISLVEAVFLHCEGKNSPPLCECGKKTTFISTKLGYSLLCGRCKTRQTYLLMPDSQKEATREKKKRTNLARYGTVAPLQNKSIQEKSKKTNLERYGVEFPAQNSDVIDKQKKTNLERYGVEFLAQNKEIRDKQKKTNLGRYGGIAPAQNKSVREKTKKTNIVRYGVDNPMKNIDVKERLSLKKKTTFLFEKQEKLDDTLEFLFSENDYLKNGRDFRYKFRCKVCNNEFESYMRNGKLSRCTTCYPPTHSSPEKDLVSFIDALGVQIITNSRDIIPPSEIDIFLPEFNLGFEFNGSYWHSTNNNKDKQYHQNKTNRASEKRINLIHIFDYDWFYKKELIQSMIVHLVGKTENKIFARECEVVVVPNSEANSFMETNHLQGKTISSKNYGLIYDGELVSVMTFGKPRFNKNYEWELLRFASRINYAVVGGASKLFNVFINDVFPDNVLTYSDRFRGDSNFYEKIGFCYLRTTDPGYFYVQQGTLERRHRLQMSKKNQEKTMKNFNPELSEEENAYLNGWMKIWDCGQNVYEWKRED